MEIRIIPAIIPEDIEDLEEYLPTFVGVAPVIHIDVCDGIFVPRKNWPYSRLATFAPIEAQEAGLPLWESFDFEVDLMVANPVTEAERFINAGAVTVILHLDAITKSGAPVLEEIKHLRTRAQVWCALSVTSDVADIEKYFGEVDGIQCMGIARIGFQGEEFDERSLEQIKAARAQYPELPISVDGAMSDETIEGVIKAGATTIVCGSYIFNDPIPAERYRELLEKANMPSSGDIA